jgi:hypothetical protein
MTRKKLNTKRVGPDPQVRRRRAIWGLLRSVLVFMALIGLGVWMALRPRPLRVTEVVPATALDDTYRPVETTDVFDPEDTFFVSVQLSGYRPDMELLARWKYQDNLITETTLNTDDVGEGYAGFSLINDNPPWGEGRYTVEIVYEDEVLGSAAFRVEP